MRAFALLAVILPFAASCKMSSTPDVSAPLSELRSKAKLVLQTRPTGIGAYLVPAHGEPNTENCFGVSTSTRAELDDEELEAREFGGIKRDRGGSDYCVYPGFELDARPSTSGESSVDTLRIWDESASFVLIARDFTASHAATVAEPAGAEVPLAGTVALASSPPGEDVVTAIIEFYSDHPTGSHADGSPRAEFSYDEQKGPNGFGGSVEFVSNTVRFAMGPTPLGGGHFNGNLGLSLPVDECDGPASCEVAFDYGFSDLALEVVP